METENANPKSFSFGHLALIGSVTLLLLAFAIIKNHGTLPFVKSSTEGQPVTLDFPDGQVLGESTTVDNNSANTPITSIRGPVILPRGTK